MRRMRVAGLAVAVLLTGVCGCMNSAERAARRKLAAMDGVAAEQVEKGNIPGAVICVGGADKVYYLEAFGNEMVEPHREAAEKGTIFDLASLSKPVATATSVLILRDRGRIGLDDRAAKYLPEFGCKGKEEVLIRHLLAHTSGLPAYTSADPLKKAFGSPCPEKVIEKICSLNAANKPGETFRYSCLGYIVLAKIVEAVSGEPIDVFARKNIFGPLGMKDTMFNPPDALDERIAATQIVDGAPLRGTVHDPLARLMGGVSGNAGVFSTADDLAIYSRMLLNGGVHKGRRVLSREAVAMLTGVQSHGRAYGFDVSSNYAWLKGDHASGRAFCHSGYTGTSIVCDPEKMVFLIVLTNSVHPHDKGSSRPLRTQTANIAFEAFEGAKR
jgi:serine-type D-Ala-D-Ala carboxypeptidase